MVSEIIQRILDRITPEMEQRVCEQMEDFFYWEERKAEFQAEEDNEIRQYFKLSKNFDVEHLREIWSDYFDFHYHNSIPFEFENKYCLPYRESIQRSNIYAQTWDARRKSEYHKIDGYYPYKRIERILENNVGKSFDGAFSYYCRKSPKYQQKLFGETINRNWSRRWGKDYIVDENGLIQGNPDRHKKWYNWGTPEYRIKSWDYKEEILWINNKTGKVYPYPMQCFHWSDRLTHTQQWRVTQGKIYEFESKDYRYHRCKKEQEQKGKKYNRQLPD